jgi:ribosomal protein L31E
MSAVFPFAVPGVDPGDPLEAAMERSLVFFLKINFSAAGFFLEHARVLAGHRDQRTVLGPAELADAAPDNARAVQVVVFGGEHREGFEGGDGSDTVELSVEVSTHLRGDQAMERHNRVVQGLRALLSRAWRAEVVAAMNQVAEDMQWHGIRRIDDAAAATSFVGDVIFTRTSYEAVGYRIYDEGS